MKMGRDVYTELLKHDFGKLSTLNTREISSNKHKWIKIVIL